MSVEKLVIPDFLLCEVPIKGGDNLDKRMWIYSRMTLSLIEIIPEDYLPAATNRNLIQKRFLYKNSGGLTESFLLVLVQNNCGLVDFEPLHLLVNAWQWFENYLKWEDGNIDSSIEAQDN
jgi:hypothetical protein